MKYIYNLYYNIIRFTKIFYWLGTLNNCTWEIVVGRYLHRSLKVIIFRFSTYKYIVEKNYRLLTLDSVSLFPDIVLFCSFLEQLFS